MSNTKDKASDFTQGSIPVKLIKFMIPIFGALILQAMYGAVDLLVVGRFGTSQDIAAVSTGSSIINLVTFTVTGLTMGVTILIGRYVGEKKNSSIGKVIGGAICFFIALSLILSIIMLVFADVFVTWMHTPVEAFYLTTVYVRICGGGLVFIVGYNVISGIFRGIGNSKLPLLFVFIACIANVVGDLVLVAGFHLNVAGAAIATIFAQAVSVILSIVIIRKQQLPFHMTRKDIRFNSEILNFVRMGSPIALQEALTNISFLVVNAIINNISLDAASGYGIAQKVISFIMLIPASLMQSMSAFIAQNVGAGEEKRAKKAMAVGMGLGAGIGVIVFLLIFFKGDIPASIFTQDTLVIGRAAEYLRGFSLEAIITCILFSFMGYFNGHEKTLFVMAQGLAQSFLIRMPVSYIMSLQPNANLTTIGIAVPASTIFGIILCSSYYVYMNHQMKKNHIV